MQLVYHSTLSASVKQTVMDMLAQSGTPVSRVNSQMHSKQSSGALVKSLLEAAHTVNKSSAVAEMGDRRHNTHGPKRGGSCCAPFAGAVTPSSTMWHGPRSTSVPSGVFIHPAIWPQKTWAKIGWWWVCPFSGSGRVHIEHNVA